MPNCSIFELLYFLNYWVVLFVHNAFILAFWKQFLNILHDMRLLSGPESILYVIFVHLYLLLDSNHIKTLVLASGTHG